MKPVLFRWSGHAMEPAIPHFRRVAAEQFSAGHLYVMEVAYHRSAANHAHFFLAMQRIWDTMPESVDKWWPNIDVFRKWTLIQCGWYRMLTYTAETEGELVRHIMWLNKQHEYTEAEGDGMVVVTRVAKSMSFDSMSEREFRRVKEKAFALWFSVTGIDAEQIPTEEQVA